MGPPRQWRSAFFPTAFNRALLDQSFDSPLQPSIVVVPGKRVRSGTKNAAATLSAISTTSTHLPSVTTQTPATQGKSYSTRQPRPAEDDSESDSESDSGESKTNAAAEDVSSDSGSEFKFSDNADGSNDAASEEVSSGEEESEGSVDITVRRSCPPGFHRCPTKMILLQQPPQWVRDLQESAQEMIPDTSAHQSRPPSVDIGSLPPDTPAVSNIDVEVEEMPKRKVRASASATRATSDS